MVAADVLDWRYRWVPPAWHGKTPAEVVATKPLLFDHTDGPVAVLDGPALRHNLRAMADWCTRHGVSLAPHGKATMAPRLIAAQLDHGAWGMTVASLAQARVLYAHGVKRIVVANEVVDAAGLRWVASRQREDPAFELFCWVDSVAGVALLDRVLADAGAVRPLDVLVEMGLPGGRAGCRTLDTAAEVAAAVGAAPRLRLVGVAGYEGIVQGGVQGADQFLAQMRAAAHRVEPFFGDTDEVILSAGGSVYFDRVAELLGPDVLADRPIRTVIRSGCYLTHDAGYYAVRTPAARGVPDAPRFQDALRVWARVLSRPEPELVLLAAGRRDLPYDQGLPLPVDRPGWQVTALNDQHAYLRVGAGDEVGVGGWVALGIAHPCSLFDRWNLLPVVDGRTVVDLVHTYF